MNTSITLSEPYRLRPIRFLELWEPTPWRLKVYGISYQWSIPSAELLAAAKSVLREPLDDAVNREQQYGVGFVGVHEGKTGNFVFVDWWSAENELHHHVYQSTQKEPTRLSPTGPRGPVACVWDLALIGHERQAWIDCVLANPHGPDLDAYLARRMEADV